MYTCSFYYVDDLESFCASIVRTVNTGAIVMLQTDFISSAESRCKALTTDLKHAQSSTSRQLLSDAISITKITFWATSEIVRVLNSMIAKTLNDASRCQNSSNSAITDLKDSYTKPPVSGDETFDSFLNRLKVRFAKTQQEAVFLQWDLIKEICEMWLKFLNDLYDSTNRSVFFDRAKILLGFALSQIPVAGAFVDAIRVALDLHLIEIKKAKTADDYFNSLESYVCAGKLFLFGVFSLGAEVDSLVNSTPLQSPEEIQDRIEKHIAAVNNGEFGKLPWCS